MASAALAFRRLGNYECKTRAVQRELQVGNVAQAQRSLWSEVSRSIGLDGLLSEERFCQKGKGEKSADAKPAIHLGFLQGSREKTLSVGVRCVN